MADAPAERPRLGLALGGGAALGFAHIGVLRVLIREGLEPDLVAGTSMGALVGAAYVSDRLDALEAVARSIDWRRALQLTDLAIGRNGFVQGERIEDEMRRHFGVRPIETLPKPYAAVATDLITGTRRIIDRGDLVEAVRASISLPGIFVPVRAGEALLVDGGLMDNLPVSVARGMGADLVIGVNVTADFAGLARASGLHDVQLPEPTRRGWRSRLWASLPNWLRRLPLIRGLGAWAEQPSLLAVTLASTFLMIRELTLRQNALHPADCEVAPELGHISLADFDRADELIALGEAAMEEALPRLRVLLDRA
jgi:NTE family protein